MSILPSGITKLLAGAFLSGCGPSDICVCNLVYDRIVLLYHNVGLCGNFEYYDDLHLSFVFNCYRASIVTRSERGHGNSALIRTFMVMFPSS